MSRTTWKKDRVRFLCYVIGGAAALGVLVGAAWYIEARRMGHTNDSSGELGGLVLTIRKLEWKTDAELICLTSLWFRDPHGWALDFVSWVWATFYDSAGREPTDSRLRYDQSL
jgi:hypothetical protein